MSEEENKSVEEVTQEAIAQPDESTDTQESSQETPEQRRQRNDAEYNWAEMRRQMREKDREISDLRDQFREVTKKPESQEDDLSKLAEDDILTVAQAKKLATKFARQAAESVMREKDASTVDERIQSKYPDFKSLVTRENIEILKEIKPRLAESLLKFADDPYQQSELAYEYIKTYVPTKDDSMSKEKKKALENTKKPMSVQSVGKQSPIGQVHQFENGLTSDMKTQLWKEMQEIRKGA